jgi:hypothetical protein
MKFKDQLRLFRLTGRTDLPDTTSTASVAPLVKREEKNNNKPKHDGTSKSKPKRDEKINIKAKGSKHGSDATFSDVTVWRDRPPGRPGILKQVAPELHNSQRSFRQNSMKLSRHGVSHKRKVHFHSESLSESFAVDDSLPRSLPPIKVQVFPGAPPMTDEELAASFYTVRYSTDSVFWSIDHLSFFLKLENEHVLFI